MRFVISILKVKIKIYGVKSFLLRRIGKNTEIRKCVSAVLLPEDWSSTVSITG